MYLEISALNDMPVQGGGDPVLDPGVKTMRGKHPSMASWEFVVPEVEPDTTARVWLDQRFNDGLEIWRYERRRPDRSGDMEWTASRRTPVQEASVCFVVRFAGQGSAGFPISSDEP